MLKYLKKEPFHSRNRTFSQNRNLRISFPGQRARGSKTRVSRFGRTASGKSGLRFSRGRKSGAGKTFSGIITGRKCGRIRKIVLRRLFRGRRAFRWGRLLVSWEKRIFPSPRGSRKKVLKTRFSTSFWPRRPHRSPSWTEAHLAPQPQPTPPTQSSRT